MEWKRRYLIVGSTALALAGAGAGVASATGGGNDGGTSASGSGADQAITTELKVPNRDDGNETVSGSGADEATAAALKITDGGQANSVERDGENGATWEVEVTKSDGNTVDVRLDENYKLVVIEGDNESS